MTHTPLNDLQTFIERALRDENVSLNEIEGIVITPRGAADKKIIDAFWNELMMFVNDYDIRMSEKQYNDSRKGRLRSAFDAVIESGLF